jgi:hypothetical protein
MQNLQARPLFTRFRSGRTSAIVNPCAIGVHGLKRNPGRRRSQLQHDGYRPVDSAGFCHIITSIRAAARTADARPARKSRVICVADDAQVMPCAGAIERRDCSAEHSHRLLVPPLQMRGQAFGHHRLRPGVGGAGYVPGYSVAGSLGAFVAPALMTGG